MRRFGVMRRNKKTGEVVMRGRNTPALAAVVCALAVLLGQEFGSVNGTITDPTGAPIMGADVQLSNTQTGFKRKIKTDLYGRYAFLATPIGDYELSIQSAGFQ